MRELVRQQASLVWVAGRPAAWARDHMLLAATVPTTMTVGFAIGAGLFLGVSISTAELASTAALGLGSGLAVGAVFGAVPMLLQYVRGRVSLPMIAVLLGCLATTVSYWAGTAVAAMLVAPVSFNILVALNSIVTGLVVGGMWLPYTMASVTGRGSWLVLVTSALAVVPVAGVGFAALLGSKALIG